MVYFCFENILSKNCFKRFDLISEIDNEKNAVLEKAKKDKEELANDLGRQINSIAKKYEK